jgi:hypothetical protein
MRRVMVVAVVLAMLGTGQAGAARLEGAAPALRAAVPPVGAISDNVEFLANVPGGAISLNFIGDTMFVSTTQGLYSYDVSNPTNPVALGVLPMYIWQNEDMDVDPVRKRVFLARDPRGFTTPASGGHVFPYGAVHIVDVSNPRLMTLAGTIILGAGHTTTCINDCDFLWTGGPYKNAQTQPADWVGRPIFGHDVRDPANPKPCPAPIDLGRNDGVTDYAHDVQVDDMGIAWVSGGGGVRGYWTSGDHLNPLTGKVETATACEPIPYAGGGSPTEATPSRFMHNAWRNLDAAIPGDEDSKGSILYATEEAFGSCATTGRFATYDLRGSYDGEGWRDIATTKFRMTHLDTWTPEAQPGATGCASAHYLSDRGDGLLAYSFYAQGTRFLDVSDPRDIRQVGYFRPDGASSHAAYWRNGLVYTADTVRGVDILRFRDAPGGAASPTLVAPLPKVPLPDLRMDPDTGYMCLLPTA